MKTLHRFALVLFAVIVTSAFAAEKTKPLKALLVTGGCCHDYAAQKKIIPEGISARANVEWTIVHEGEDRDHRISIYSNPDWSKGYDVVVHNECYGFVNDVAFVNQIAAPHKAGLPAVFLHCSSHSYRMADDRRVAAGDRNQICEAREARRSPREVRRLEASGDDRISRPSGQIRRTNVT